MDATSATVTVIFQPSGRRGQVKRNTLLTQAAQEIGEGLEMLCGGKGTCGKCKVFIESGHFPKYGITSDLSHVSPFVEETERPFITLAEQARGGRLACMARVENDILVFVPEMSRTARQIVAKKARLLADTGNPVLHNASFRFSRKEALSVQGGDLGLILQTLQVQGDLLPHAEPATTYDLTFLQSLPAILKTSPADLIATIWNHTEIIRITPKAEAIEGLYGISIDVGTTTLAATLARLDMPEILATRTTMNPQIKFGEDIIARISYAKKGKSQLMKLHSLVIMAINDLIEELLASTWPNEKQLEKREQSTPEFPCLFRGDISDMVLVGNTVIHHLLLGIDPQTVGRSPFMPVVQKAVDIKAKRLDIDICPSAYVHFLPNEAGFVGADNVGVLITEQPYKSEQIQLIIDIGTNGELLLGNEEKVLSCSCATGPAFEGAEITFGMRASQGAIERVWINPHTWEATVKVIGANETTFVKPCGICGSGILDLPAELYTAEIIESNGRFVNTPHSDRLRKNPQTDQLEFVLVWAKDTAIGQDITLTQHDIRQIQLAKAAIYTGCVILMQEYGTDHIDIVKIAGGFGLHVDPLKILLMGMLPDISPDKILPVGNAAGTGALAALLSREKRQEAAEKSRWVRHIDLAGRSDFKNKFMAALSLPHDQNEFPIALALIQSARTQ